MVGKVQASLAERLHSIVTCLLCYVVIWQQCQYCVVGGDGRTNWLSSGSHCSLPHVEED